MMTIGNISCTVVSGRKEFIIDLIDEDTFNGVLIKLPLGDWSRSTVINALIRAKYSQDHVEAIINNHFLNIAEWLDQKFQGEDVVFEDAEYDELQAWRKESKMYADMIIEAIEKF